MTHFPGDIGPTHREMTRVSALGVHIFSQISKRLLFINNSRIWKDVFTQQLPPYTMNRMITFKRNPSSTSSLEESTQRMNSDDQQIATHDVEFMCQTEASFPRSTFRLSDKISKVLSQHHFERLFTLDTIDDLAQNSQDRKFHDSQGEPDYYEDLVERSDEEGEVLIVGLDLLENPPDNSQSGDDSSWHSITEDSLKVMKRRMDKKRESQMKRLSDFRRSFARQQSLESEISCGIHESRNTTSPPCAWRRWGWYTDTSQYPLRNRNHMRWFISQHQKKKLDTLDVHKFIITFDTATLPWPKSTFHSYRYQWNLRYRGA